MSSRLRNAANIVPAGSGRSAGTSLTQCTARSASPGEQRGVDLLGERALAVDLREVAHPLVAGRPDRDDLGADAGVERGQFGPDALDLGQGHGRVAGDDADQLRGGHASTIDRRARATIVRRGGTCLSRAPGVVHLLRTTISGRIGSGASSTAPDPAQRSADSPQITFQHRDMRLHRLGSLASDLSPGGEFACSRRPAASATGRFTAVHPASLPRGLSALRRDP